MHRVLEMTSQEDVREFSQTLDNVFPVIDAHLRACVCICSVMILLNRIGRSICLVDLISIMVVGAIH